MKFADFPIWWPSILLKETFGLLFFTFIDFHDFAKFGRSAIIWNGIMVIFSRSAHEKITSSWRKKIKSFSTSLELNLEDILVKSFLIRFTSH